MPKFFVKKEQVNNGIIIIENDDVKHIKNVLRKQIGDKIEVCNQDDESNFICEIEEIEKEKITCKIIEKEDSKSESKVEVTIFQGLPKADKMELIIQKSVELGAYKIVPTSMKRCVVKVEQKDEKKKIDRWQKISEVAAKQCGRDIIPNIEGITNVDDVCKKIKEFDLFMVAYEEEKENNLKQELSKVKDFFEKNNKISKYKIGVLIGPEGGIDSEEIEKMEKNNAKIITLGNRILRTETVALNVLSIIMYEIDN